MTRRTTVSMIAAGIVLVAASAGPARAQYREDIRPVRLYIDLGYVNLFDYPKWMMLGPELELRLHRLVTVNPEVTIWLSQSFRGDVNLVPGATVNLRIKRFFIGGGAVRRVSQWTESAGGWLVPKFQAGYRSGPARLGLSVLYLNQTKEVAVGMTLGFGIGRRPREPED